MARAHLLGARLGGLGNVVENLVTFAQNPSNSPIMRDIEGEIADVIMSGQRVFFAATPVYAGKELIPRSILLTAQGSGGYSLFFEIVNALVK